MYVCTAAVVDEQHSAVYIPMNERENERRISYISVLKFQIQNSSGTQVSMAASKLRHISSCVVNGSTVS